MVRNVVRNGAIVRYAILGFGIVVAAILFYDRHIKYGAFPKRFAEVVPGKIYRSGMVEAGPMARVVAEHGIRTIVDLGAYTPGSRAAILAQAVADELGVDRIRIDNLKGDTTGDPNGYVQALKIMTDPARQPVLVHCGAGAERTGCVVILYRNIIEDVPIPEAYKEAEAHWHDRDDNPHMQETLDRWADDIERSFHTGEPIDWTAPAQKDRESGSR